MRVNLLHLMRNLRRSPASAIAAVLTLALAGVRSWRYVLRWAPIRSRS